MPAVRPSAHPTTTTYHDMGHSSSYDFETQVEAIPSPRTPTQDISEPFTTPPASKKRRSPNAFILFRSHIIANKLYPSDMKHQNDISRFVADMWRSVSASERALFFKRAEEEKIRYEIEGPVETQKKKRTRKPRAPKRYEIVPQLDVPSNVPQVPASPPSMYASSSSSIEDNGPPVPILCTPTLDFYTPLKHASTSLTAPQPMPIYSPFLLGWNLQTEPHRPCSEGRVFPTPEWLSSSHATSCSSTSSGMLYNDVADFDNALQLELDLLLSSNMAISMSMDTYPDFASPVLHMSSSKRLPYPFDAYNVPLAPL